MQQCQRPGCTNPIDHGQCFREKPACEAIERTRRYVAEHEWADWKLPTGVVDGIYD